MKKILYIGGFEMPDGNAAAQRVLAIAKALRMDYDITFLGVTHKSDYSGTVDGFKYINLPYPSSKGEWLSHLSGSKELKYIKEMAPDMVFAYNFPALGLWRVLKYCKKKGIKVVGDITEWYQPYNFLKRLDTYWRMVKLNKQMDGLILISKYLENYYKGVNSFNMPPTVDSEDDKWSGEIEKKESSNLISLLYAGSPGRGNKDRLDGLIRVIGKYSQLSLDVVGIGKDAYMQKFPEIEIPQNVIFWGRLSHEETVSKLRACDFSIFFRQSSRVNNAGFPTKFAEAQSAGIPVISCHFSDLDKYVEEGKNGFLANSLASEDIDTVLDKVSRLSRQDIQIMHKYTRSLNRFDYRVYQEDLVRFVSSI